MGTQTPPSWPMAAWGLRPRALDCPVLAGELGSAVVNVNSPEEEHGGQLVF